jgi:hypothetical protein
MACQQIAKQAKREALARLRDNQRINDAEFSYSPSTGAVGIRWEDSQIFRVFNVNYPMYRQSESVTDWVSVGKGTHKQTVPWVEVDTETVNGVTIRLSRSIRVF